MTKELTLSESVVIPYGNMGFLADVIKHPKLYDRCVQLEQTLRSDYDAFASNYRHVLEEFALCEETQLRIIESGMRFNEQTTRERVTRDIKNKATSYVDLIINLCLTCENTDQVEALIKKQCPSSSFWDKNRFEEELERYVRALFRFGSVNSHSGERPSDLIPTENLCRDYFRKLYTLLAAYYGCKQKVDGSLYPFREYYPVPQSVRKEKGITLEKGKFLYVKESEGALQYFLFVEANAEIPDARKRDIETVHRLWMDNVDSPQNVINNATFVSNKNEKDNRYWAYPLPSFPVSLTDTYIDSLSQEERREIARGILRGVASMHHAEPPFYHRSLSPSAFLICKIRNRLKPLLINFDSTKDTDENAQYTVLYAVSDKLSTEELKELFAPELYEEEFIDSDDTDWEKVDVFALGKTILKIFANTYVISDFQPELLSEEQYNYILRMCSEEPMERPHIDDIIHVF